MEIKNRKGILFLCTGNSCRSQMAEGFARAIAPHGVRVYSAGLEPEGLNPRAVKVMAELGIDISCQHSKSIEEIPAQEIGTVITLCGDAEERCPAFPGKVKRIHWPLPDPAKATGSEEEILGVFRRVRDEIKRRVEELFRNFM
jgi:arsenate reductase